MSALTPCTSCARHVRVDERACPFCRSALSLLHTPPRATPTQRLGRGALFAFGTSVASAMGCSQATTADVGGADTAMGIPSDGGSDACVGCFDASYGGAPDMGHDAYVGSFDAAYGSADVGPSNDAYGCPDTNFQGMYGSPPPCDANAPDASADDAGEDAWGAALYGAPPQQHGP